MEIRGGIGNSQDKYKKEGAKEFTDWVNENIGNITTLKRINELGEEIESISKDKNPFNISKKNDPDSKESEFCEHKNLVIKSSIKSNLQSAISNYNAQSEGLKTTFNFKMPILKETEWDKMISEVSIITFMQGLKVGFTTYNNYMIVSSSKNLQYVSPDSLYFVTKEGEKESTYYHRINCPRLAEELKSNPNLTIEGYKSLDFEPVYTTTSSTDDTTGKVIQTSQYISKHTALACYDCIISSKVGGIVYNTGETGSNKRYAFKTDKNYLINFVTKIEDISNPEGYDYTNIYNDSVSKKLRNAYYNALFKERYRLNKISLYVNDLT